MSHEAKGTLMNHLRQEFAELSSDHLLQMRASGDRITDQAHQTIEEIFAERGERLPPKPKAPIVITVNAAPISGAKRLFKYAALTILALVIWGVAKALAHTWIGALAGLGVIIYSVTDWFRRQRLLPAQREHEDNEKEARELGLTEIMVCASTGDLDRLRDLVEYGGAVNARSVRGATALMYAAKSNHVAIVDFLLAAGADPKLKSNKGSSAMDIAKKSGNHQIAARLEEAVRFTKR